MLEVLKNQATYEQTLNIYSTYTLLLPPILFAIDAPYGRFASNNRILGFGLSQRWSKLEWFTMEIVSPVVFTIVLYLNVCQGGIQLSASQACITLLWYIHYIHRTFIYTYRVPSMAAMGILTWVSAVMFNFLNAYTNSYWVARYCCSGAEWWSLSGWLGTMLWCIGFVSNIYHDSILFDLRSNDRKGYFIPKGGLFEYVSCPNYFSECIEWIGFALICRSEPSFWFALSTMANLIPRAYKSHQWYQQRFKDAYPRQRKAIIPFLL